MSNRASIEPSMHIIRRSQFSRRTGRKNTGMFWNNKFYAASFQGLYPYKVIYYLGGLRRVNKNSNSASPQQDLMLQAW